MLHAQCRLWRHQVNGASQVSEMGFFTKKKSLWHSLSSNLLYDLLTSYWLNLRMHQTLKSFAMLCALFQLWTIFNHSKSCAKTYWSFDFVQFSIVNLIEFPCNFFWLLRNWKLASTQSHTHLNLNKKPPNRN